MFMTEILQRKLLVRNLMHRRARVGDRTDLIGVELFPPVQRGSDVEIDRNHPHELTMVRAGIAEGVHEFEVVRTDMAAITINELCARKNHDYGDSFHTTFVEEGLAMARIRLGDKFSRFKTLSRLSCNDRDQQQVTDESIRDTLLDLANYAIMTVLEMDAPDESHATMYAYDKPFYTVGEDK